MKCFKLRRILKFIETPKFDFGSVRDVSLLPTVTSGFPHSTGAVRGLTKLQKVIVDERPRGSVKQ